MSDTIPVNGEVLKWARESAGLTIDEVVQKMKRKCITYKLIESGEKASKRRPIFNLKGWLMKYIKGH